jgi:regulator of nucleoside diphosphate kinase
MQNEACMLTTKDFTILEVMFDRCLERDGPMAALLRRKINAATVVFRDDIPPSIATLSSRVTYRVDGGEPESRVLSHDVMASPVGLFLPITTLMGLALLGLSEGQEIRIDTPEKPRRVHLEAVLYQPEAARREREAMARLATPAMRRSALRVVPGAFSEGS